ncbi:hypothetical protein [Acetivibrio cellulolyticus]|uniref:hypothetical protein n=1 Tax=Acetivibrio cellulolyticus TaxID=35830 RepID=UPI0001E2F0BD|nr:hypothetical protein [Acetivibrio cellulolyticus]
MIRVKNRLLSESVKFVELCQGNVLSGRINLETYNLLSNCKINFLRNFISLEKQEIYIDRDFSNRINNLFAVNNMILKLR